MFPCGNIDYLCVSNQHGTKMKKNILGIIFTFICLCACNNKEEFKVSGQVTSADNKTIILEAVTLNGIESIDSLTLDADGKFLFEEQSPASPEFYRLRIDQQIINFSIDSTEHINIHADFPTMGVDYKIEGSYNCIRLKELAVKQIQLERDIMTILKNKQISTEEQSRIINEKIIRHKDDLKKNYILEDPAAPYAYFALFQAIGEQLVFNPIDNREDIKYFGAVATAWDAHYPQSLRTEHLRNIALQGIRNTKPRTPISLTGLNESQITTTGIIDISLPDKSGEIRNLSGIKNKVVLLDFTAYSLSASADRIMQMRGLYKKYHAQGFEIYQVSIDSNEHFWKTSCEQLPWICVYDSNGEESNYIRSYQIYRIPSYFLINKDGDLVARDEQIQDLEKSIKLLLRK